MTKPITTTLSKIRKHSPCEDGWKKLYKALGGVKKYGEHTPLKFSQIVKINGLDDALWCLRSICPEHEKEVRLYAADCAEKVLHLFEEEYPDDDRPRKAIQAARDLAEGKITEEEMAAAWAAASDAARDASDAASDAARDASDAAWAAASDAAWAAASDASDAAWASASDEGGIQTEMLIERFG